ncbi:hypothetical protein PGC35_16120 [Psychrobacillus sp. PGGUH221]|uniref:hypothetical protein n=1 Tax=Psychrobacillus sp. PGGUH221 TaxID=3020058 RepID=UPI0035C6DE4D
MSKHLLSVSIVLLSIAICFLAYQIGNIHTPNEVSEPVHNIEISERGLLTSEEVAVYLSMDVEQFKKLIKQQNLKRAQLSSYDTYTFIPYIQMNGEQYFTKQQVDEWINYNIMNGENIHF